MSELKTIGAHIDYIRELLRQTSDDTNYPDELIYKAIIEARAILLYRSLSKHKFVSEFNYQTFCLPLELTNYTDCECIPEDDCKVLKSTIEIPIPMVNQIGVLMQITDTDRKTIYRNKRPYVAKLDKYKTTNKDVPYYDILNRKAVIFRHPDKYNLKLVLVTGIFEDPMEVSNELFCTNGPCYEPLKDHFPLEGNLIMPLYELVLKQFGFSFNMVEDDSNDASQDNIKKQ